MFLSSQSGKLTWIRTCWLFAVNRFCDDGGSDGGGGGGGGGNIDGDNDAAASSYPTRCDTDIFLHGIQSDSVVLNLNKNNKTNRIQVKRMTERIHIVYD